MSFLSEFKKFAMRGNVVDMAVGVILGGAFGQIVTSLVNDVIMPPIGYLLGGVDFSNLAITMNPPGAAESVVIRYGAFLNTIISFLIIAFCIFIIIRMINKLTAPKHTDEPAAAPAPTTEEKLLTEIRDLLQKQSK